MLAWLHDSGCVIVVVVCVGGGGVAFRALLKRSTGEEQPQTLACCPPPCLLQFYLILKLQQGVWPELPWVHIWDYARWAHAVHAVLFRQGGAPLPPLFISVLITSTI